MTALQQYAPAVPDRCTCGGIAPGYPMHEADCGAPEDDGPPDCHHRNPVPAGTPGAIECRFCGVTDSIRPVTTEVAA